MYPPLNPFSDMINLGDWMNYIDIIEQRQQKKRKILVEQTDVLLEPLKTALEQASHKVQVLFAFKCIESLQKVLDEVQTDHGLLKRALENGRRWAHGEVKMTLVKPDILAIHQLAKETSDPVLIAYLHAYGQGLSVIHTPKHVLGLPIYELTGFILQQPNNLSLLEEKVRTYLHLLNEAKAQPLTGTWAKFIQG